MATPILAGVVIGITAWSAAHFLCRAGDSMLTAEDRAWVECVASVHPSPRQLAWQQRGMGMFIHFGMNTFTGGEWGNGQENPMLFNATARIATSGVKSLRQLMDIYYSSVGRNAALLLNLTPDQRGLIPELDAQRAKEFGDRIRATFATNLLAGARVAASNVNRQDAQAGPGKVLDGDFGTYWRPEDWSGPAELTFALEKAVTFNRVLLQENIALGQRIERFGVDAWVENSWREIGSGTTVGYKRLLRLRSPVTTDRLRVRIPEARVSPTLAEVGAYWEP